MHLAFDADLRSIQEARQLAAACAEAQRSWSTASQEQVDRVCAAIADAAVAEAEWLGRLAHDETGYGVAAHKKVKNEFAAAGVWASIRDLRTVGVIASDEARRVYDVAWPVGVIAALIPSTNPTSTAIFKTLICIKARNGIVFAPHPSARRSSYEAVRVMRVAGEAAGMPAGLLACMEEVALAGTQELMHHPATSMVLATGGTPMVRAAHSTGKPALGVGPGNVPVYVDRSADVATAARNIVDSKAFDCSVICATEQAVVADAAIAVQLRAEMERVGAYWVDASQKAALGRALFSPNGAMNPHAVGRTPQQLAQLSGITVPGSARVLVAELDGVGPAEPLSREKLTTVLGWYVEEGWHAGCERALQLLHFGGDGHSLVVHATDEDVILHFAIEKPAFRIVVNTWGSLGAVGATTGLAPSFTLAPGGVGGAVTSDNITVRHVLNIKRLAHGLREPPAAARALAPDVVGARPVEVQPNGNGDSTLSREAVERVIRRVLAEIGGGA